MDQIAGRPYWIAQIDKDGGLTGSSTDALVSEIAGWG